MELNRLGVSDEQVTELRTTLVFIRAITSPRAARNDVAVLLKDVERLSSDLVRKLDALAGLPDAAHGTAFAKIEERYWQERPEDDGHNVAAAIGPRLSALVKVAREAQADLPDHPTRNKAGDPRPIRSIQDALLRGWIAARGSRIRVSGYYETEEAMVAAAQQNPPLPRYPKEFLPSVSEGSSFHEIVGICYLAAGYKGFPKRALQAYNKHYNDRRRELLRGLEAAIAVEKEGAPQNHRR
ncbi:hypothetical protein JI752_009645 [Lysobacter sp. MMG2]|uniref:hypothetical protein n=1 Tax=Lysobacter sp. MMG2 TaxID=2801338 RepID=UPI001C247A4B|nr:hypothetical protein [Lysobacter sp. MMG2]MBU8976400.1 hypothetical protein [Lysobacter sp. MMG2]